MRDPARIDPILAQIRRLWTANPDLRLGQLICILARTSIANAGHLPCPEVFHLEDDVLSDRLENNPLERGK